MDPTPRPDQATRHRPEIRGDVCLDLTEYSADERRQAVWGLAYVPRGVWVRVRVGTLTPNSAGQYVLNHLVEPPRSPDATSTFEGALSPVNAWIRATRSAVAAPPAPEPQHSTAGGRRRLTVVPSPDDVSREQSQTPQDGQGRPASGPPEVRRRPAGRGRRRDRFAATDQGRQFGRDPDSDGRHPVAIALCRTLAERLSTLELKPCPHLSVSPGRAFWTPSLDGLFCEPCAATAFREAPATTTSATTASPLARVAPGRARSWARHHRGQRLHRLHSRRDQDRRGGRPVRSSADRRRPLPRPGPPGRVGRGHRAVLAPPRRRLRRGRHPCVRRNRQACRNRATLSLHLLADVVERRLPRTPLKPNSVPRSTPTPSPPSSSGSPAPSTNSTPPSAAQESPRERRHRSLAQRRRPRSRRRRAPGRACRDQAEPANRGQDRRPEGLRGSQGTTPGREGREHRLRRPVPRPRRAPRPPDPRPTDRARPTPARLRDPPRPRPLVQELRRDRLGTLPRHRASPGKATPSEPVTRALHRRRRRPRPRQPRRRLGVRLGPQRPRRHVHRPQHRAQPPPARPSIRPPPRARRRTASTAWSSSTPSAASPAQPTATPARWASSSTTSTASSKPPTDGTVLAVAHTDKGDHDTRGYSGIEDDADVVWAPNASDMFLTLELTKMKDGPDGRTVHLEATAPSKAP